MINNNPQVITTGEKVKPNKKWFQTWRIIYPILGIVVLVELVLGAKTLLTPLPQMPKSQGQKLLPSKGAEIRLSSSKASYKIGEKVPVTVHVSTGGYTTIGTDLVLRFNPEILEVSTPSFIRGKIYAEYPQANIDNKNGIIRVSGMATNINAGFNGVGELGVINFKSKAAGKASVVIDFKKGVTADSNILRTKTSEDVLRSVTNLNITVQ